MVKHPSPFINGFLIRAVAGGCEHIEVIKVESVLSGPHIMTNLF